MALSDTSGASSGTGERNAFEVVLSESEMVYVTKASVKQPDKGCSERSATTLILMRK